PSSGCSRCSQTRTAAATKCTRPNWSCARRPAAAHEDRSPRAPCRLVAAARRGGAAGLGGGRAESAAASAVLRRDRAAHLPLVLGYGEPEERPGSGPLADALVLQHRLGRLRTHRLSCRHRARLVLEGRRARPNADHLALLLERAAGAGADWN